MAAASAGGASAGALASAAPSSALASFFSSFFSGGGGAHFLAYFMTTSLHMLAVASSPSDYHFFSIAATLASWAALFFLSAPSLAYHSIS